MFVDRWDKNSILQVAKTLFQLLVCIFLPIIFVFNIEIAEPGGLRNQSVPKEAAIMTSLPSPEQTWVHAVDNRRTLLEALQNDTITAIETDLLMGTFSMHNNKGDPIPIMAHPPNRTSDLRMTDFWQIVASRKETVQKVIKLDFKERETLEPTLQAIADLQIQTNNNNAIFLNADILPGPGHRDDNAVKMPAQWFLETCLKYIQQLPNARIAFSLGYKADCADLNGYTAQDAQAMADLIAEHELLVTVPQQQQQQTSNSNLVGVVLALNARQLAKSLRHFDEIMEHYPSLQILAWTGKGELPIPQTLLQSIQEHYQAKGMAQRVGYDCQVSSS